MSPRGPFYPTPISNATPGQHRALRQSSHSHQKYLRAQLATQAHRIRHLCSPTYAAQYPEHLTRALKSPTVVERSDCHEPVPEHLQAQCAHPVPTQPTTRAHLRGCHRRPHPVHMPGSDAQAPPQSAQRHTQQTGGTQPAKQQPPLQKISICSS